MSLTINQLQVRSRAFYAPSSLSLLETLDMRAQVAAERANDPFPRPLGLRLGQSLFRTPSLPEGLSPLAADLFSIARPLVRPSDVRSVYESIECAPHVGVGLSVKV